MPRDPIKPEDRDAALLLDMPTAARAVRAFVAGRTLEEYAGDLFFRSAVERQIEIVGEAARGVSEALKRSRANIARRAIMAQRHRLAHEYGSINDELIWTLATVHVPTLIAQLEPMVEGDGPSSG